MIKSYTDIEQSKKLAEILPLDSADMMWEQHYNNEPYVTVKPHTTIGKSISCHCCNCWSLAALLGVLPRIDIEKEICFDDTYYYRVKAYIGDGYIGDWYDNPVGACVDMIQRLHESNLL